MKPPQEERDHINLLRRRAEEALRGQPVDLNGLPAEDIQFLLHELHVHQVELGLQNEELRRVQEELEISRDRYSDLYNYAPAGYCTLSHKGTILEANQTLSVLLGIELNQLVGSPLSGFVDREFQDEYYLLRRRTFADHQRQVSEIRMVKSTGEQFFVRMESEVARGDDTKIWVILSDISDRKKTEEALRETQARLRIALENAPISLYTTDGELRYTWTFGALFGLPPESVLGKRDDELVPAEHVAELTALKRAVLESRVGQRQEVHFKVEKQNLIHDVVVEPLVGKQGEVTGLTVASMDITKQRLIEKELQKIAAQQEVQHRLIDQREHERQQIARDLHDGPVQELTAVTLFLRSLLMDENYPEIASQLEAIQVSLQAQIHELRTYAGELRPPTLATFGLEQAIRSHAETFQERHPDICIWLEMHQTGEKLSEPMGLALYRIYQQAMANIIKHAHATKVWVEMEKDGQKVQLAIRDNGQGFELPDDWFELVRNGHLGLLGMRERAEAVGGKMEVISQPGGGTLIQVNVPLGNQVSVNLWADSFS